MFTEFFGSVFANFKQKVTNPFLGTIILVWFFRNWELVYALFVFDDYYTLEMKTQYIKGYYQTVNFYGDLFLTVVEAFILMVLTFLLLAISRLVVELYDKRLMVFIYKIFDRDRLVKREELDRLVIQNGRLERRLTEEREKRMAAESDNDNLEEEMKK